VCRSRRIVTVRSRVPFEANECARGGLNIISVGVIVWGNFSNQRLRQFVAMQ